MSTFKVSVLFAVCICKIIYSAEKYPRWFIYPTQDECQVIGFSYQGTAPIIDAERMYWIYRECIVKGLLYRYDDFDERHSDYYYYFPYDSLQRIKGKLFMIDQFMTSIMPEDYIAMFSIDTSVKIERARIRAEEIPVPSWVDKSYWEDENFHYGVGMYSSRLNENDAWKSAEERAYFEIMNCIVIHIFSVKISTKTNYTEFDETASAVELHFRLRNIQVLERYPDVKNQLFYVLVRIKKSDVQSPLLNQK